MLAGLAVVAIFAFHGATFLTLRTQGDLFDRAGRASRRLSAVAAALGAVFLVWTVVVAVDRNDKRRLPAGAARRDRDRRARPGGRPRSPASQIRAFAMTGLGAIAVVATLFTSLFPRVMVSSTDFANSLTVSGSASAHYTLAVMSSSR